MACQDQQFSNFATDSGGVSKPIRLKTIWIGASLMLLILFGGAAIANHFLNERSDYELLPMPPDVQDLLGRMDSILAKNVLLDPKAAIWSTDFCRHTFRPWVPILVVNTQPSSKKFRTLVRSFLKPSVLHSMDVVFTCGLPYGNGALVLELKAEVEEHKDLIVGAFMDKPDSTYNEGPVFGLLYVSQCLNKSERPERVYINVSEFTPVNYRNLADWVTAAYAVKDWTQLIGAPGFEDLKRHYTSEGNSIRLGALLSRWQDVNIDSVNGTNKVIGIPHSTFISSMGVVKGIAHNIKNYPALCKKQGSHACMDSSIWQLVANMAHDGEILALSSNRLGVDSFSLCQDATCECSDWLTLKDEDDVQSLMPITETYRKCPGNFDPMELSTKSQYTGLAGTSIKGPALPEFHSNDKFCDSLTSGIAIGILCKSDDFKLRAKVRDWFAHHNTDLRPAFAVGRNAGLGGQKVYDGLQKEQEEFGDLIIGDYYDRYETLSSKTMMIMKWFDQCAEKNGNLNWLIKCDADIIMHPRANVELLKYLWSKGITERELSQDKKRSDDVVFKPQDYPFWLGRAFHPFTMGVISDPAHQNFEDTNLRTFPAYCSGPFYIVSRRLAQIVLKNRMHPDLKDLYFRNEDAMIGILIQHWNDHMNDSEVVPETRLLRDITPNVPISPMSVPGIFCLKVYEEAGVCESFRFTNPQKHLQKCTCSRVLAAPNTETTEMENLITRCQNNEFGRDDISQLREVTPRRGTPRTLPKLVNLQFPPPKELDQESLKSLLLKI